MRRLVVFLMALAFAPISASGQFRFRDLDNKSVELTEKGSPVFVYNYGTMLKEGVAPDRARCCYLHPVYATNGAVVTDDFPKDHPHHRGISWMWPIVIVDGQTYDLWTIKGIQARFERWERRKADKTKAVLTFQDGWYVGDRRVVQENVQIVAHPAAEGRRDLDITVALRSVGAEVSIGGTKAQDKGYGGALEIRFAPRAGTKIRTAAQEDAPDSDRIPAAWAELTADYGGKVVTTRVTGDPSNPGAPNGWCLRHYGFLGVEYPGLEMRRLDARVPLTMKFQVSLSEAPPGKAVSSNQVLVYTHNGKGYVHDNISATVEAIRKMGAENGFSVEVTDDPAVFDGSALKRYKAVVFANTNNEAFTNETQREAFKRYIQSGGGFVGIHSASGSERNWPYFWSVLGGTFEHHAPLQTFLVRVTDPDFPANRQLPATFKWKDECYFLNHMNPDLHVVLATDPAKLHDPERGKYAGADISHGVPLAWCHQFDGGREYYLALGHNKEDYSNPLLYNQILGGILWAMGEK